MIDHQTHEEDQDLFALSKRVRAYRTLSNISVASAQTDPPDGSLHEVTMACSVHQLLS